MRFKSSSQIRRENLGTIIASQFKGKQEKLAAALNKHPNTISRVMKTDSAQPRNIGDGLAREIENTCGVESNWLDNDHELISGSLDELRGKYNNPTPDKAIIKKVLEVMDLALDADDGFDDEERADLFAQLYSVYERDPQTRKLKVETVLKLIKFEEKENG